MHRLVPLALLLAALFISCSRTESPQGAMLTDPGNAISKELKQLDMLALPEGISHETWTALKAQMRAILLSAPLRTASAPPFKAQSAAQLTFDGADTLTWGYASIGDCDQNSEVNVADLTPIGVHFGASAALAHFPYEDAESVIDGDGNGQINISDLTPIGANFHASVRSYNVYTSLDQSDYPTTPDAVSTLTPIGTVDFVSATGDKTAERLQFSFTVTAPQTDAFYWVRPSDGTTEGTPSTLAGGSVTPTPPTVSLTVYPNASLNPDLGSPMWLTFSAFSTDTITNYEYDLDGDGTFEISRPDGLRFGQLITGVGDHTFTVRVTDDQSLQGTDSVTLTLKGTPDVWHAFVLDTLGTGQGLGQLAAQVRSVAGHPAVVYDAAVLPTDSSNALWYRRASDANGAAWDVPVQLAPEVLNSGGIGFAVINGNPAVAFNPVPTELDFLRADDANGTSWGALKLVDSDGFDSTVPYMIEFNSLPAIAYSDNSSSLLNIFANEPTYTTWSKGPIEETLTLLAPSAPSLVDDGGALGMAWSTALAPDATHIRYRRLDGVSPTVDVNTVIAPSAFVSMQLVGGNPAILYADTDLSAGLTYQRALDPLGAAWGLPVLIPGGGFARPEVPLALAVVSGVPAVVWGTSGTIGGATLYCEATDALGAAWGNPVVLNIELDFWLADMAEVNGHPAVIVGGSLVKPETLYFGRY